MACYPSYNFSSDNETGGLMALASDLDIPTDRLPPKGISVFNKAKGTKMKFKFKELNLRGALYEIPHTGFKLTVIPA